MRKSAMLTICGITSVSLITGCAAKNGTAEPDYTVSDGEALDVSAEISDGLSENITDTSDTAENVIMKDGLPYSKDDYVVWGRYEQDGNESNGPEPIEWEVLENDENGVLLISRYILDVKPYNTENVPITWEECSLRSWLNGEFMMNAFTENEQAKIANTPLLNPDNAKFGTPGGNATTDKIFLLSTEEVISKYSFSTYYEDLMRGYSEQLIISPTTYAKKQGCKTAYVTEKTCEEYGFSTDCLGKVCAWWWLRTPGQESNTGNFVYGHEGTVGMSYGDDVDSDYVGVRPAMYLEK